MARFKRHQKEMLHEARPQKDRQIYKRFPPGTPKTKNEG